MSAEIFPFPVTRRRAFIAKQAAHAALMNPEASTRYLQHQISVQAETMRRKGIAEDLVQQELRCMRTALQARFISRVDQPER